MFTSDSDLKSHLILNSIISAAFLVLIGILYLILRFQNIPTFIFEEKEIDLQPVYFRLFLGGAIMCVINILWNTYVSKFWFDRNNLFMDIASIIVGFAGFCAGCALILANVLSFPDITTRIGLLMGHTPDTVLEKIFVAVVVASCISMNFSLLYSFIIYARDDEEWEIFEKISDGVINWLTAVGAGLFTIVCVVFMLLDLTIVIRIIFYVSLAPYIIQIFSMIGQYANKNK